MQYMYLLFGLIIKIYFDYLIYKFLVEEISNKKFHKYSLKYELYIF